MTLLFDNPLGFWALAAVPAIVTIHFLRPAARHARVSTLFLLEHLDPGVAKARRLRRLRTPPSFWLQILAALLATWLLLEPRWRREGSRQTVAVVLDASASMRPFRGAAEVAVRKQLENWSRATDHTTWLIRESDSRRAPLYQGESAAAALAALARWEPNLGQHDLTAIVNELRYALGAKTPVVVITDHPGEFPPGTGVVGVGQTIANTGFVGATVEDSERGLRWRALVLNSSTAPRHTTLTLRGRDGQQLAAPQALDLAEGKVLSVEGAFPAGAEAVQLELGSDGFDLDDHLPLVRPREREVRWSAAAGLPELLQRFSTTLEAARRDDTAPDLRVRVVTAGVGPLPASATGHEIVAASGVSDERTRVATAPLVGERHPLVDGLAWDGLLSSGPATLQPAAGATVLLWQGTRELVWLESFADSTRLVLNFDVAHSNAARLPAFVVLLDRYLASVRTQLARVSAVNLETHQRVELGTGWSRVPNLTAEGGALLTSGQVTAPALPGFFTVRAEAGDVLFGAARFGDAREGDFRQTATFSIEGLSVSEAARAASQPDPWRPLWLLALGGCLCGAWWSARGVAERRLCEHPTSKLAGGVR